MAVDRDGCTYKACAERLRLSILTWHPDANITVITGKDLPHGDLGGFANDWQCWQISPYRETIKLEADMVLASPIDHWWNLFELRDVVISKGARDFYGQHTSCRTYRRTFDHNHLPDLYNAVTYWRVSQTAQEFFRLVQAIFTHWSTYRTLLKYSDEEPTTDVVYAIAAVIVGAERVTLPLGLGPSIVHMKAGINSISTNDWTQELTWETDPMRINTVAQWGPVHYHVKPWQPDE